MFTILNIYVTVRLIILYYDFHVSDVSDWSFPKWATPSSADLILSVEIVE